MVVYNRIKILECKNLTDSESKVNDFLANDPDIQMLVDIKYYLEDGIIIIEYVTFRPDIINNSHNTKHNFFSYYIDYWNKVTQMI